MTLPFWLHPIATTSKLSAKTSNVTVWGNQSASRSSKQNVHC